MPSLSHPTPLEGPMPLAAIAAYGLVGSQHAFPPHPLTGPAWDELLAAVRRERLTGLLAAAILGGAMPVTDAQLAQVAALQTEISVATLFLERTLLAVSEGFGAHDIELRVLKGPAVARLDYPEPELRVFTDIDVLVRSSDLDAALAVLARMGARRQVPDLRPGFSRRFGKGATLELPDGLEVDLQRTFVAGPLGLRVDLDMLFDSSSSFLLGDCKLMALPTEERFLHSCFGAALGRPARLHNLRDIAQLALDDRLDVDRALDLAHAWDAHAVVARAVNMTWSTLAISDAIELTAWAGGYHLSDRDARVLDAYVGGDQSYTRQALAAMRVIPTTRLRLAYARALLFPAPEHLDARRRSRFAHLRRGARHLSPAPRRPDHEVPGDARG